MARLADGRVIAIDYAGTAPTGSKAGMFASAREANVGYKSIAVPGTVAGMGLAHERHGRLKWAQCLEPARRLAGHGFPASQRLELILKLQVPVMKHYPDSARVFLHGGEQPLRQNEIVLQPDLADTLRRMQKSGWREFYAGETARRIAADMAASGGLITYDDLKNFAATPVEPIRVLYRGHPVLTMPPSSSGGVALAAMLNVADLYPLKLGMEGSAAARHLQIEAMRRGFFARNQLLRNVLPLERLVTPEYARELTANLSLEKATPAPAREPTSESPDTTHFTIVDAEGNVVTNTYTLSGFFGSQVIARRTGVLLNNHMSVFYSLSRTSRGPVPGQRYPSTMAPTIILKPDGSPYAAIGTPGGAAPSRARCSRLCRT